MAEELLKDIVIDDMVAEDIPAVIEIERMSCNMPWSEALFFNEIKNPGSIPRVARSNGKAAGYICANTILDEGHILNLAVHPGLRRIGIASALISDVIARLSSMDCRAVFLEVRISNEDARRMYERFNFKEIGVRKNYYGAPVEDAVVMVLKLREN